MWSQYCWWGGMWVFPLLMLIMMIVGLFLFAGRGMGFCGARSLRTDASGESALEMAKKRYAKGEITKQQFEELKRDLAG